MYIKCLKANTKKRIEIECKTSRLVEKKKITSKKKKKLVEKTSIQ